MICRDAKKCVEPGAAEWNPDKFCVFLKYIPFSNCSCVGHVVLACIVMIDYG